MAAISPYRACPGRRGLARYGPEHDRREAARHLRPRRSLGPGRPGRREPLHHGCVGSADGTAGHPAPKPQRYTEDAGSGMPEEKAPYGFQYIRTAMGGKIDHFALHPQERSPADHLAVGKPAGGHPWQPTSLKNILLSEAAGLLDAPGPAGDRPGRQPRQALRGFVGAPDARGPLTDAAMGGVGTAITEGQEPTATDLGQAAADRRHTVPGPHRYPVAGSARQVRAAGPGLRLVPAVARGRHPVSDLHRAPGPG